MTLEMSPPLSHSNNESTPAEPNYPGLAVGIGAVPASNHQSHCQQFGITDESGNSGRCDRTQRQPRSSPQQQCQYRANAQQRETRPDASVNNQRPFCYQPVEENEPEDEDEDFEEADVVLGGPAEDEEDGAQNDVHFAENIPPQYEAAVHDNLLQMPPGQHLVLGNNIAQMVPVGAQLQPAAQPQPPLHHVAVADYFQQGQGFMQQYGNVVLSSSFGSEMIPAPNWDDSGVGASPQEQCNVSKIVYRKREYDDDDGASGGESSLGSYGHGPIC